MFGLPLIAFQAYAWIGGASAFIMPILKKVPWQVWAAIGGIIAVLWYGHIRENRGYAKCQQQVKIATDHEVARQAEISQQAIQNSIKRAQEAEAKAQEVNSANADLQREVDGLKNAKTTVCLPSSITKRYRN